MLHWASELIIKVVLQDIFNNFIHYSRLIICIYLSFGTFNSKQNKEEINGFEKDYPGPMDNVGADNSLPRRSILLHPEAHN